MHCITCIVSLLDLGGGKPDNLGRGKGRVASSLCKMEPCSICQTARRKSWARTSWTILDQRGMAAFFAGPEPPLPWWKRLKLSVDVATHPPVPLAKDSALQPVLGHVTGQKHLSRAQEHEEGPHDNIRPRTRQMMRISTRKIKPTCDISRVQKCGVRITNASCFQGHFIHFPEVLDPPHLFQRHLDQRPQHLGWRDERTRGASNNV